MYIPSQLSKYSLSEKWEAEITSQIVASYLKSSNQGIIVDGTAGIGGNVLSFAQYFPHVFAIEQDIKQFVGLHHNTKHLKNLTRVNGNALQQLPVIEHDILFLDPPWGGPKYKFKKSVDLFLFHQGYKVNVMELIEQEWQNDCSIIALKAPFNFNSQNLYAWARHQPSTYVNEYKLYHQKYHNKRLLYKILVISRHDDGVKKFDYFN